jgi:hypothetical protein
MAWQFHPICVPKEKKCMQGAVAVFGRFRKSSAITMCGPPCSIRRFRTVGPWRRMSDGQLVRKNMVRIMRKHIRRRAVAVATLSHGLDTG